MFCKLDINLETKINLLYLIAEKLFDGIRLFILFILRI